MRILVQIGGVLLFIAMLPLYLGVWIWHVRQEKKLIRRARMGQTIRIRS